MTLTLEEVVVGLEKNDKWVERAILAIYDAQTIGEKAAARTSINNNVGFSAFDARRGTYYAEWVNKGRALSGSHLDKARKLAIKYRKQLVELANAKGK